MQNQLRGLGHALAPTVVTMALVVGGTAAIPAAGAPQARTAAVASSQASSPVLPAADSTVEKKKRFSPKSGVKVTNPLGTSRKQIMNHILKAIRATPKGEKIRLISWNIASRDFVKALINAHERGVSVRVLMSQQKADDQPKSGDYWRLRRALRKRNGLPARLYSWARGCNRSCRGTRGIAHSKLFLFSRVGRSRNVVMSTSANATDVAVYRQWNDLYTNVGNAKIYNGFIKVFLEAAKDKPVRNAYRTFPGKSVMGYVYPWRGAKAKGDRVKRELKRIKCRGARGGTGINGRTRIRIAQDAIIDKRGQEIARILRDKWEAGCNMRITYALMNNKARKILNNTKRGPVPRRQIVQDWDNDGIYDRYLHAKVLAVSGVYRNDHSARVAWQGSENWSGLAKISDEQGFRIRRGGAEGKYARWVDWMFTNPPPRNPATTLRVARARGVDPYALIKEELGLNEAGVSLDVD